MSRFLAPVKFYRDEPRTMEISALLRPDGEDLVAECRLTAERQLVGQAERVRTTHFTGRVVLAPDAGDLGTHERPEHPERAGGRA